MKKLHLFLWLILPSLGYAQEHDPRYDLSYKEKFDQVRYFLGGGRTSEAFVLLQDLYKIDTANHYTNYLIGICYTEQNVVTELSCKYLEYAAQDVMSVYKYIPHTEKKAPVYVWYYLTKAYSQNGLCDKAQESKNRFLKSYKSSQADDYFIKNIESFASTCKKKGYKIKKRVEKNVITKHVEYSSRAPIYAVQVGAFKELVPIREEFGSLKNVEAFLDTTGVLRYVVGKFGTKSQAGNLLHLIKEKGYKDAFVVDINGPAKFSKEVIIVDQVSFKAQLEGNIAYAVQIGAYSNTDSIPDELAKKYLQVEEIKEIFDQGLTILSSGNFSSYDQAKAHTIKMQTIGILDAFVIAVNNGKKVSLKAAEKYLEQQKLEEHLKEEKKESKKKKNKSEDEH